ncbi:apolipoprotein N-acyltransferase [uncultured Enterovirga sp.]|uniref:apolipoprotein N-acyltransferase n=1 Tax=uncultured Enterovirga sp. TaxID=2026352 RepID=UPI0035CBBCF2
MRAIADRIILLAGWRRALVATLAGAVGALSMPPLGIWPALAISLTAAVWLLDGSAAGNSAGRAATLRRAAIVGWFWGFGYFVAGLWWIGAAFLVEADVFAWLLPAGVLGLPAVLALFPAFGFALARLLWSRGPGRLFALAVGLTVSEWLRGHLFTGFPWNTLGLALGQNEWLMQSASVLGLWGLTLVAVLALATPATLGTEDTRAGRAAAPVLATALLAVMALLGAQRLATGEVPAVAGVKLRVMQPNLPQDAKFRPANGSKILRDYLALSDRATSPDRTGLGDITHLIWPESAFPFLLHREPNALAQIAAMLPRGGILVTGAARQGEGLPGEVGGRFYNSIQAIGSDGAVVATYDKVHLVPFGEYVPHMLDAALRSIGIREFVKMPGGFTPGERRAALRVAGLPPAAATVCYEAIFPDEVVPDGPRPGLILNVTNDGWFGQTAGPYQHFAQARLRSVETGLPLVRAANTGISAVVDPYGRIWSSLPLGQEGILDSALPAAIAPTLQAQFGKLIAIVLCTFCAAVAIGARGRLRR